MPVSVSIAAFAATVATGCLIVLAAGIVSGALGRGGRRDRPLESDDALAISRFTIPVSVIVPVDADTPDAPDAVRSLLALNYPELEVIVVAEGRALGAVAALRSEWGLEPKEFFYRKTLDTAPVRRIYGSARDSRLIVIEKTAAGRADALNCGVSLARFRYLLSIAPDVRFDADALLRVMAPALIDPGGVLAVTSAVERRGADGGSTADFQALASLRSWMATRLTWHQDRPGLAPSDSVIAWRRDAVLDVGGFSTFAADPQMDLLVRLQTSHPDGRVVRTSEVFGHAPTLALGAAAQAAAERRRALLEAFATFWKARGRAGRRLALLPALAIELVTPLLELFVVAVAVSGAIAGWLGWIAPAAALVMLVFGNGLVSAAALLLRGGAPGAPAAVELRRLLIRTPLEPAVYRPALVWARLRGYPPR
jgi:cellulose synthase/poly-beta-1,6-N-acetylglucosamine synthase-like glycosyltransferase